MLGRDLVGALDPCRRDIESPGENQRERKPEHDQDDDELDRPVGKEKREDPGGDLRDQPSGDDVGNGHAIDPAPFELGEKSAHEVRSPARRTLQGLSIDSERLTTLRYATRGEVNDRAPRKVAFRSAYERNQSHLALAWPCLPGSTGRLPVVRCGSRRTAV